MAKNKPKNKLSVNDLVNRDQKPQKKEKSFNESTQQSFSYDEEMIAKLKTYNENIGDFDKMYSSVVPRQRVIVRAFTKEIGAGEDGLISNTLIPIPIPAKSGPGSIGYIESPWPFSKKVIVVSAPPESDLKSGDVVMYDKDIVTGIIGSAENVMIKVNNGFVHPDEQDRYFSGSPTDPTDKNYGYLLVHDFDLIVKL